jgi:hypothetical protein
MLARRNNYAAMPISARAFQKCCEMCLHTFTYRLVVPHGHKPPPPEKKIAEVEFTEGRFSNVTQQGSDRVNAAKLSKKLSKGGQNYLTNATAEVSEN